MALTWPDKDPNEVLDYQMDWSARLAEGDTISSSLWIVPAEITKDSDTAGSTSTTIWLSGGSVGDLSLTNRVTTVGGRVMDQSVTLTVVEK